MHIFKHFRTITKHRHLVCRLCFKTGLYKQGLTHDLSKYSFIEFFNGAKYYQGTHSPNHNERLDKGYSEAWMHHKGRNKHHVEYWVDVNYKTNRYEAVDMPRRYLAESVCDRIAASKIYKGKKYTRNCPIDYFYKEVKYLPISENTKNTLEKFLKLYVELSDKEFFKTLKNYVKGKY